MKTTKIFALVLICALVMCAFPVLSLAEETKIFYDEVDAALEAAGKLNKEHYEDFTAVEQAVKDAEDVSELTTQQEVDAVATAIRNAIKGLKLKPADYSKVDEALKAAEKVDRTLHFDYSKLDRALWSVHRNYTIDKQDKVNAMAQGILDAIEGLQEKEVDYTRLNSIMDKVDALDKDDYYDFSAVEAAVKKVTRDLKVEEQSKVDYMSATLENAVATLVMKPADYTEVDAALAAVKKLDKSSYVDFSQVQAAVEAVVTGKMANEQEAVDAMAKAILDAISKLVVANPKTSDAAVFGIAVMSVVSFAAGVLVAKKRYA